MPRSQTSPFNSPFETGVRTVVILQAAAPKLFDLEQLTTLDHLVVHTKDLGGPDSLHPPVQARWAELVVRRKLVQDGIALMVLKGLVRYHVNDKGHFYSAGDEAATFVDHMHTDYAKRLTAAAEWLAHFVNGFDRNQLRDLARRQFERWSVEFQSRPTDVGDAQ
jgi:hypothetical protein